ncbi:MAG: AAA family ATPase [Planctomycetota bacterium]|nr:AAA family ATPase [Planctomycetota bacterium]
MDDREALNRLKDAYESLRTEIHKVIVGQDDVVRELLVAIFSQGHCILEGVPGLAKTLLVSTLARSVSLSFNRIQFTPDLMPADITGTEVIEEDRTSGTREFRFIKGPVFANVILADEINRTPPKTQAALLEAMQERQVTINGERHVLPEPFFVLATQNPIEQEGTYPLPEAQQDRFMFKIKVTYPTWEEEREVVKTTTAGLDPEVTAVLSGEDMRLMQRTVRRVPIADHVIEYAIRIVRRTRVGAEDTPDYITENVSWGAGPRACQFLVLGAKARAAMEGRSAATTDDVKAVAHPVLRHRILTNFAAESAGVTADTIVDRLLDDIPAKDVAAAGGSEAEPVLQS